MAANNNVIRLQYPTTNVPDIDSSELMTEIKNAFELREALYIWGAPGIGKTEIIEQASVELNVPLIFVELNIKNSTDFTGIPEKIKNEVGEDRTKFILPEFFPSYNHYPDVNPKTGKSYNKGGIIFVDEANRASTSVLNACLQLVGSRRLESYSLPEDWIIIGAGNRPDEVGASGSNFDVAMGGRWKHFNFVPTVESWIDWGKNFNDRTKKRNVPDEILNFVEHMKDYFFNLSFENINNPSDQLYASPRNWARAGRALQLTMSMLDIRKMPFESYKDRITRDISACVGVPTALAFCEYMEMISYVDFDALKLAYTVPDKAPLPPKIPKRDTNGKIKHGEYTDKYNPAVVYALQNHILAINEGNDIPFKQYENLTSYVLRMNDPEYAAPFMSKFRKNFPTMNDPDNEETIKTWKKILKMYSDKYSRTLDLIPRKEKEDTKKEK